MSRSTYHLVSSWRCLEMQTILHIKFCCIWWPYFSKQSKISFTCSFFLILQLQVMNLLPRIVLLAHEHILLHSWYKSDAISGLQWRESLPPKPAAFNRAIKAWLKKNRTLIFFSLRYFDQITSQIFHHSFMKFSYIKRGVVSSHPSIHLLYPLIQGHKGLLEPIPDTD